jgi:hypothetical protein
MSYRGGGRRKKFSFFLSRAAANGVGWESRKGGAMVTAYQSGKRYPPGHGGTDCNRQLRRGLEAKEVFPPA